MQNYTTKKVYISTIATGTTVEHNGKLVTVCNSDIKTGGFFGVTIFGDSYRSGYKSVKKVEFVKAR